MTELDALLSTMTPAQRAQFDAVNQAVAADVVTVAERKSIARRARRGGKEWRRLVADLSLRVRMTKHFEQ